MNTSTGPLIWRGVLAIAVGVIAVAGPAITVGAFVILFAVYAFLAAGMQASRAFRSDAAPPVVTAVHAPNWPRWLRASARKMFRSA
jgi:uncharacterized membrane protein HdeD (DUF308 family)